MPIVSNIENIFFSSKIIIFFIYLEKYSDLLKTVCLIPKINSELVVGFSQLKELLIVHFMFKKSILFKLN